MRVKEWQRGLEHTDFGRHDVELRCEEGEGEVCCCECDWVDEKEGLVEEGRREEDDGREGKDDERECVREMGIGETNERKEKKKRKRRGSWTGK